jgi:tetratricopeptide (TPR) repeat protein
MKAKDDIFRLIKTMSHGEKRLFKATVPEDARDSNYTRLFDAIDKQNEYDENKIKLKFAGEKFIRHLPAEKNYLLNNILKMLRNFPEDGRIAQAIMLSACEAEVLFSKGLFEPALLKITKAIAEAGKYECFGLCLELMQLERRILLLSNQEHALVRLKKWHTDFKKLLAQQENLGQFILINTELFLLSRTSGSMLSTSVQKNYRRLVSTGVMKDRTRALSASAELIYHQHKLGYAIAISDIPGALKHSDDFIHFISKYPALIEKFPQNYITALYNNIVLLTQSKKYAEAEKVLKQLQDFPRPFSIQLTPAIEKMKFQRVVNHRIELLTFQANTRNVESEVDSIKAELAESKNFVSDYFVVTLHFNFAVLFFSIKNYSAALKELEYILSRKKQSLASDYKEYARLLLLFVHFEKGNYELLPYLIRSHRLSGVDGIRQLLLDLVLQLSKTENAVELRKIYLEFKTVYDTHPEKKAVQQYLDFSGWLAGKLA